VSAREGAQARLARLLEHDCAYLAPGLIMGGMDEAGRGPLAGPVVAACAVMPPNEPILGVNDSKKLGAAARGRLFAQIEARALFLGVGMAGVEEIEALNIRAASRLAMERAAEGAQANFLLVDYEEGLALSLPHLGIAHGDALSYQIACASIAAKVTRDRLMLALDGQYPGYGFAAHKGYGTAAHCEAILRLGPSPAHRPSFLRKLLGGA
jgi:ribonuclease HII